MVTIVDQSRFVRKPGVIATDLGNELVLLDPETRQMYRLNQAGRVVWQTLQEMDAASLARLLVDSFEVTPERAREDLHALLVDLLGAGLVVSGSAEGRRA